MTDKQVTQRQIKAFRRFANLLPRGQDLTLVILKGHLLIEEQVRQIINERVKTPESLRDANLDSHQAICLAEAFYSEEHKYIWDAVKKLNKLRNKIAHKTEPTGLDDRLDDFVKSVPWLVGENQDRQQRIQFSLWALFEAVSSLVERPTATMLELVKRTDEVT